MSNREITIATVHNMHDSHRIVLKASHHEGQYSLNLSLTEMPSSIGSTGVMVLTGHNQGWAVIKVSTGRFSAKRLQNLADDALSVDGLKLAYEVLISKEAYCELGFPQWYDFYQLVESPQLRVVG